MPSSTSSSKPLALLLGITLFALCEAALWSSRSALTFLLRHQPDAETADAMGVSAQIGLLKSEGGPVTVLLGSSQVREGIDCRVLTAASSSDDCLNLGIGGGAPLDMLYILRELGVPRRPVTIVASIFPGALHQGPKSGFIDTKTARLVVSSAPVTQMSAGEMRLLGLGLLQQLSPTFRNREGIRDSFKEWETSPEVQRGRAVPYVQRTAEKDRQPPNYFENMRQADDDNALTIYSTTEERALDALIQQATRNGQRLVIVDFPTRSGYDVTLGEDVRARYAALLSRLRSRPTFKFVGADELRPLPVERYLDFTHVDAEGRRLVSERLREILSH